jgi:hypothetical protein
MSLNDVLQHLTGARLVRKADLEALGVNNLRRANEDFNRRALDAVQTMERHNGKALTATLKRASDEYAMEVLGSLDYSPWLYVYATMSGAFKEGWMPDNFYFLVVVPRITKGLVEVGGIKSFSNVILKTSALPDIAYHIDNLFYDRDFNVISRARLCEIAKPFAEVFVKQDGGGNGTAIAKVSAENLKTHNFEHDCVLQRPIRQHPLLDEMVPGSVATLRINTAKSPDGSISQRGAVLRLGRTSTEWVQSANQIQVRVSENGTLDDIAYMADWRSCSGHPDTEFMFSGQQVPQFDKAMKFCLSMHAKLPHVPLIGWDVAVNADEEVELIEWNGGYSGIKFHEAASGPQFRDMGWERFARMDR